MPVTLAQGHIRTPEFTINVESTYMFYVLVKPEFDVEGGPCLVGVRCPSELAMSWSLYNGGRVVAHADKFPVGRILGGFIVGKGRYVLDLDVRQDGSRLNAGTPHLVIFEEGHGHENALVQESRAFWLFMMLAAVGCCVIIRSAIVRRQEKLDAVAVAWTLTQPGPQTLKFTTTHIPAYSYFVRKPRPSRERPFSRASTFGLIATITHLMVLIPIGVMQSWAFVVPMGLRIHLLRPGITSQSSPGIQPLRVHVASTQRRLPPITYVGSRLVAWEDFETVLQYELNRRPPNWPVYLDGDPGMEWGNAVKVMDRIRGLKAEVVLLTDRR